jgi:hypothetical protein
VDDELVGFEVLGRHGVLGVVIAVRPREPGLEPSLWIQGGVSRALVYVVPVPRIRRVVPEEHAIVVDVDVGDFVPSLHSDGTVELRVSPS